MQIVAQQSFKIKDYVPDKVVIEWKFKNNVKDGLSPIIVKNAEKMMFGKVITTKRTENNGDYHLQSITNRGLEIYQLYFVENRFIEYENPIILVPAKLKIGEVYKTQTLYKTTVNGELKEQGTQTYEVKAERVEDVITLFGKFANCLIIRTIALRIDESASQKGYELEEWYAKGVGAVKVVGTLFWKNDKGETTRTFKVDAELEKLVVPPSGGFSQANDNSFFLKPLASRVSRLKAGLKTISPSDFYKLRRLSLQIGHFLKR